MKKEARKGGDAYNPLVGGRAGTRIQGFRLQTQDTCKRLALLGLRIYFPATQILYREKEGVICTSDFRIQR